MAVLNYIRFYMDYRMMRISRLLICFFILLGLWCLCGCTRTADENVVWSFSTEYPRHRLHKAYDKIFISSDRLYCLSSVNGRLMWNFESYGVVESKAIATDKRVYFVCGALYCLNAEDGRLMWEYWSDEWGTLRPAVGEKYVYAVLGGTVYSVDRKNGRKIWSSKEKQRIESFLLKNHYLLLKLKDQIVCVSADTGNKRWSRSFHFPFRMTASGSGGVCILNKNRFLLCLDVKTGIKLWEYDTGDSRLKMPACIDEYVYVLAMGNITACNASNGKLLWERSLEESMVPAVYEDILCAFLAEKKHHILFLNPQTGETEKSGSAAGGFSILTGQYAFGSDERTVYGMRIDYDE